MNRTHIVAVAAAVLLVVSAAAAEVQTREIEYKEGEAVLQGLIAWDDALKGLRPGVLVVHEWWGHNEHARYQAKRLAEAGYVGFALDMFGKGKVTTHPKDAQGFMSEVQKDPAVIPARFHAALELLKQDPPRLGGPHCRHRILLRRVCGSWRGAFRGRFGCGGNLPRRARDEESCGTRHDPGSDSRAHRRSRSVCSERASGGLYSGDEGGGGEVSRDYLSGRQTRIHESGCRQGGDGCPRVQCGGRQKVLGGDAGAV
jgi:hypothetical protein